MPARVTVRIDRAVADFVDRARWSAGAVAYAVVARKDCIGESGDVSGVKKRRVKACVRSRARTSEMRCVRGECACDGVCVRCVEARESDCGGM